MSLTSTLRKEIETVGIEIALTTSLVLYGKGFKEPRNISDLAGIAIAKEFYKRKIAIAGEMGINVSEYPAELNHLDYLLK